MAAFESVVPDLPSTPTSVFELPERDDTPSGRERRIAPRLEKSFLVRLADDGSELYGIDLSFGGLMCAAEEPVWPGNLLDLELVLAGDPQPIFARARVVELVGKGAAIAMRLRFEGMSAVTKKRVARWVAQL